MTESKRTAYRNTRNNAIRLSSATLGYPYVKASAAEAKSLATTSDADAPTSEGGKPPKSA